MRDISRFDLYLNIIPYRWTCWEIERMKVIKLSGFMLTAAALWEVLGQIELYQQLATSTATPRSRGGSTGVRKDVETSNQSNEDFTLTSSVMQRGSTGVVEQDGDFERRTHSNAELAKRFREGGGIVYFLHVPKTGGSTVRAFLSDQLGDRFMTTHDQEDWKRRIEILFQNGTEGKTYFLEDHFNNKNSPVRSRNLMMKWRGLAQDHNIPLFTFTMFREPMSYARSNFNYYWVHNKGVNATEQEFLKHLDTNKQCHYLLNGLCHACVRHVTEEKICLEVSDWIFAAMDWISTTEHLSDELLPLIAHLGKLKNIDVGKVNPTDSNEAILREEDISPASLDEVQRRTKLDNAYFYERVGYRYNFSQDWGPYLKSVNAL